MQIINRLFPYPIYSSEVDDYIDNCFDVIIENVKEVEENLCFDISVKLSNQQLLNKVNDGYIDIYLHIECPKTSFRISINMKSQNAKSISIPSKNLNGAVEICCLLIAAKEFILDFKFGLNEDYKFSKFNLEKGNIVGYFNVDKIILEKDTDELLKPSSIFSVVKKKDALLPFDVTLDDSKRIKIVLNEETYIQFLPLQNENCLPIIHGIIVLPALIYTIERLKECAGNFEEYEDKSWFFALNKQLQLLHINITEGGLESKSSIVIAQELLKLPVNRALNNLSNIGGE